MEHNKTTDSTEASFSANLFTEDACAHPPAFETFLALTETQEYEKFFQDITTGAVICCEVEDTLNFSVCVTLLCFDSPFERSVYDLKIQTDIPIEEFKAANISENRIERKTLLRACVQSIDVSTGAMKLSFRETKSCARPLGIITEDDLPLYFRNSQLRDDRSYRQWLENSRGFNNPLSIDTLCQCFNLSLTSSTSFFDYLQKVDFSPDKCAGFLRKSQTHKLSLKSVEKGVEKLKQGDDTVAMQHFNKALQIEEDNVEGLVARGALYANKESFDLAVVDFRQALTLEPQHCNAKKYLVETLLAQCKIFDGNKKYKRAMQNATDVLNIDQNNKAARRYMKQLKNKYNDEQASEHPSKNGKNDSNNMRHLEDMYKKYGVDAKTANDPQFLESFKKYREKYSQAASRRKSSTHDVSDSGTTVIVNISSSSSSPSDSSVVCCRTESPKKESLNAKEVTQTNDHFQDSKSRTANANVEQNVKIVEAVKLPLKRPAPDQLDRKLKSMEDFISSLKKKR